jgi:hypothetical protein
MPPDAAAPFSPGSRALKSEEQDALPAPPGDHVPAGQALSAIWQPLPLTQAEHEVTRAPVIAPRQTRCALTNDRACAP